MGPKTLNSSFHFLFHYPCITPTFFLQLGVIPYIIPISWVYIALARAEKRGSGDEAVCQADGSSLFT